MICTFYDESLFEGDFFVTFALSICIRKAENVMGIKRNKVAEPKWSEWDYAEESKHDVFSRERWGKTADWHIILKQVEKTRKASQMIDIKIYPSSLFLTAIDLLEANLLMVDDLFYYLTGVRIPWNKQEWEEARKRLVFWNMDCYEVLKKIREGLLQIKENLTLCLKQEPIWDISLKVGKTRKLTALALGPSPVIPPHDHEWYAYEYVHKYFEVTEIDQEALATQIKRIQDILQEYAVVFLYIYNELPDFFRLLALFCQSKKAQSEYIEPWRHDFGGTRDNLIAKMEKDPKLGPWVHRYDHISREKSVPVQLFYDEKEIEPVNEDECYNTDNWLSILTVAAVLQEYDEQHGISSPVPTGYDKEADDELMLKLSLYFKDDDTAKRFLKSVRDMKTNTEIIALVKKHRDAKTCSDTSKTLWRILHDANLYTAQYRNWMDQLKW